MYACVYNWNVLGMFIWVCVSLYVGMHVHMKKCAYAYMNLNVLLQVWMVADIYMYGRDLLFYNHKLLFYVYITGWWEH